MQLQCGILTLPIFFFSLFYSFVEMEKGGKGKKKTYRDIEVDMCWYGFGKGK